MVAEQHVAGTGLEFGWQFEPLLVARHLDYFVIWVVTLRVEAPLFGPLYSPLAFR